jgi:hypothetical protein
MSWNICETIYDHKSTPGFFKTWEVIIDVENRLHRSWFESGENKCRFKESFIEYIKHLPVPSQSSVLDKKA